MTPYSGDLNKLLSLDAPVLLELNLPGVSGRRYLAVNSMQPGLVDVAPRLGSVGSLRLADLDGLYTGRAYLIWKNYLGLSYQAVPGERNADIVDIQRLLSLAGVFDGARSGIYDQQTIQAVTRLQARSGIVQDGRIGPLTLFLIYQQSRQFNPPSLGPAAEEHL